MRKWRGLNYGKYVNMKLSAEYYKIAYNGNKASMKLNEMLIEWFDSKQGVRQG